MSSFTSAASSQKGFPKSQKDTGFQIKRGGREAAKADIVQYRFRR